MGPIRNRKALSCVDCRRRKVKCDRTLPVCVRCQKGGNADKCTYVAFTGPGDMLTPDDDSPNNGREAIPEELDSIIAPWRREEGFHTAPKPSRPQASNGSANSSDEKRDRDLIKTLLPRVRQLETFVRSAGSRPVSGEMFFGFGNPIGPGYENHESNNTSDFDQVLLRGKGFSTHYFGPSYPITILMQFEELATFVKEILANIPSLQATKNSMSAIRAASKSMLKEPLPFDVDALRSMVPPREVADPLVQFYLDSMETTYRILHVPSFLNDYEAFWQSPYEAKADFLVQLLLVCATVYCVVPVTPAGFVGRSSARREVAGRWIKAGNSWVEQQSKKHMTMSHFQIHLLVFLARAMNCIKIKREWASAGHLLRMATAAGMHREPSLLSNKINEFDCEMRRRLWFTIVELDLQVTINRGMMPTIDSFGWDCLPPRNIHDEEFDESTEALPPSRPKTEFTRSSFLHLSSEYLALRIEVIQKVNSIRLGVDLDTVMQYDVKIRKVIDGLPSYEDDPKGVFPHKLARLVLYECILILHIPFANQTSQHARCFFSAASRRDAGIKALQIFYSTPKNQLVYLSNSREDFCRVVLSVCHDLVTSMGDGTGLDVTSTLPLLDNIVDVLKERLKSLGQGFHSFWITMGACTLVRWKMSGQPAKLFAKEAGDSVVNIFHQSILAHQVPMPSWNGTSTEMQSIPTGHSSESNELIDVLPDLGPQFDPTIDFMNFDFSNLWNLEPIS